MPKRQPPEVRLNTPIGPDVDLDQEDVRLADGTRLTNELAEAIGDEVRSKAGRPSLTGARTRSPQVSKRITPAQQEQLMRYSKATGMSVSRILREALDQFMKHSSRARR
jgi:hypothetical protein